MQRYYQGGKTLVISDFHGPLPSGLFWKHLVTQTDAGVLQLMHGIPDRPDGTLLRDTNTPASPPRIWNTVEFRKNHQDWREGLEKFRRQCGCPWYQAKAGDAPRKIIEQVFAALTS